MKLSPSNYIQRRLFTFRERVTEQKQLDGKDKTS
jgi:hypothetical protein